MNIVREEVGMTGLGGCGRQGERYDLPFTWPLPVFFYSKML